MTVQSRKIARNASVVALATLVSRLLGFVRDAVVAFALGAGPLADAFFVAFRIPNVLRRLFAEGSMTMSFIPVFSRLKSEQGLDAAFAMARSAMLWLVVLVGGITLLAELFASPIVAAIAPGFSSDPERFAFTVGLVRICFPYILCISAVALCMGILNSLDHFMAPAMSPIWLNVTLIIAALTGHLLGLNVAVCLAFGVLAGGVAQWLTQQKHLKRLGFSWRGERSWRNPGVKRMGLLMLPTLFGAAVYQINTLVVTLLASFLPAGSISALFYADRLVEFPLGVFGLAVSTAALPSLSKLAAEGRQEDFAATLCGSMSLTLFIALPSMAGFLALAEPMVSLLFGRGRFGPEAVAATSSALLAFSAGLPFTALARPLVGGFYARENTRTPVLVATVCLVVNLSLGALLMRPLGHVGLALAVSASSAANFLILHWLMRRELASYRLPMGTILRIGALSALVFLAALASARVGLLWLPMIPLLAAAYVALARMLGMEEARLFLDMLKSRLTRARPDPAA